MQREAERAIEWDCAQVLLRFYDAFDNWNYEAMAELFTEDGVWHRAGKALKGREAIVTELRSRSSTQVIRHVVTNLLVDVVDDDHAEARLYLTAYRHDSGAPRTVPAPIGLPAMLLVVSARLLRCPDDWRITEQVMQREFAGAN